MARRGRSRVRATQVTRASGARITYALKQRSDNASKILQCGTNWVARSPAGMTGFVVLPRVFKHLMQAQNMLRLLQVRLVEHFAVERRNARAARKRLDHAPRIDNILG